MLKTLGRAGLAGACFVLSPTCYGQTISNTGQIAYVEGFSTDVSNARTQIVLQGSTEMCGTGSAGFANIFATASNYDAMVAMILTAYALRVTVYVEMTRAGTACTITRVQLQPG